MTIEKFPLSETLSKSHKCAVALLWSSVLALPAQANILE